MVVSTILSRRICHKKRLGWADAYELFDLTAQQALKVAMTIN
jgi:hypothetical protein